MQARYQLRHAPMRGKDTINIVFHPPVILAVFLLHFYFLAEKNLLLRYGIVSDQEGIRRINLNTSI
jgi:hypothetical protein